MWSCSAISALSRHRRWHVHRAGMDVPVLKMTASPPLRGGDSLSNGTSEAVILSTSTPMPAQWDMPSVISS